VIYDAAHIMRRNLLDLTQAADLLHLSPLQMRQLVARQAIPFVMVGPFVRFERSLLETWSERLASIELRDGGRAIDLTARAGQSASPERTGTRKG
jgi:excisionase family DNA binding protein